MAHVNNGFVSDPHLLPRIKEHCSNFPKQIFFVPEEIAYDLQQKFPEYNRKKFKPFVRMVQDGLNRLQIRDRPDRNEEEASKNQEENLAEESTTRMEKRSERKRKAKSSTLTSNKRDIVVISDEDEAHKKSENTKPTNRANKSLLTLYGNVKKGDLQTPKAATIIESKKRRHQTSDTMSSSGAIASGTTSQLRGLGSVSSLLVHPRISTVTFENLGGCDRQFLEVCRLVMHMKRPKTYRVLGVEPPKGFIVHGPPGCGKSLFAQAVAGQFNLPFIQIAATELVSGVSGETEEKIRQLFSSAKQNSPCILVKFSLCPYFD